MCVCVCVVGGGGKDGCKLECVISLNYTGIVMIIRLIWSVVYNGICLTYTLYIFVENKYIPEFGEF